jgi:hypothetical protein
MTIAATLQRIGETSAVVPWGKAAESILADARPVAQKSLRIDDTKRL